VILQKQPRFLVRIDSSDRIQFYHDPTNFVYIGPDGSIQASSVLEAATYLSCKATTNAIQIGTFPNYLGISYTGSNQRHYDIPDLGVGTDDAEFLLSKGAQTITGTKTFLFNSQKNHFKEGLGLKLHDK